MATESDKEQSPLIEAVLKNDMNAVRSLVEGGVADIDAKDEQGRTALMLAAGMENNAELVKYLVEKGAGLNAQDVYGKTVLMHAVGKENNTEVVKYLVEKGAKVNAQDMEKAREVAEYFKKLADNGIDLADSGVDVKQFAFGKTALMLAAERGNTEVVKYLVENNANVNAQDKDGKTALVYAAEGENNAELVKYLLENGASVDIKNEDKKTVLMYAVCMKNNAELVQYLVENKEKNGLDIDAQDKDGKTALMLAAERGDTEVVKWLVENNANVNAQDKDGKTALMLAAERENTELVKYLVENKEKNGLDINAQDKDGNTTLVYAAEGENNAELVKYLVENGASVDIKNEDKKTALMYAVCMENNAELVQYLVENKEKNGLNIDAQDKDGKTALMLAAERGDTELVKYLVENKEKNGLNIDAQDKDGRTALMLAGQENNEDTFKYLKEHGADLTIKDNEGMGITSYYPDSFLYKYIKDQRNEFRKNPNSWEDILKHMVASNSDDRSRSGSTTLGGDILVVTNQGGPFEQMMTLVHEGNHRLNFVLDGASGDNFSVEQNVKICCCAEAVAHTSECLAAALQYQRMKEAGVGTFQYQDSEGNFQDVPIEVLLDVYSPELREYVTKNGFDPNNKKDVEAVTEIGLQFWEKRKRFYVKPGGQFDAFANPEIAGEGISQKKFDALINRMCEGVVIGDGVELDLRQFADRFNGMTDAEVQRHVSRANGYAKQETKEDLKKQRGEFPLVADYKERQDHFDEMVNGRSKGQSNTVTRQGAVEPTKKQEKQLDLAIIMKANGGRG